jgi:hypothetical protein
MGGEKMMKKLLAILAVAAMILAVLPNAATAASSFEGFEAGTGDWFFYDGGAASARVASGAGTLGVTSSSGSFHAEVGNLHDSYQGGYGNGGYSLFGGKDAVYQGAFYQSIDVYIDPTWSAGNGFWIDMSPADVDGTSLYAAEGNFRLTGNGSSVDIQAINSSTLSTISTAGWYTFRMEWSKGTTPTSLINMDLSVFDSSNTLLGSESFLATFPQGTHPGESQYLGNNSYVWLTVWENGYAGDVIAIDNVRTGAVPIPSALWLLGSGLFGIVGIRSKFKK